VKRPSKTERNPHKQTNKTETTAGKRGNSEEGKTELTNPKQGCPTKHQSQKNSGAPKRVLEKKNPRCPERDLHPGNGKKKERKKKGNLLPAHHKPKILTRSSKQNKTPLGEELGERVRTENPNYHNKKDGEAHIQD